MTRRGAGRCNLVNWVLSRYLWIFPVLVCGGVIGTITVGSVPAANWPGGSGTTIVVPGTETDLSAAGWIPLNSELFIARQNGQIWRLAWNQGEGNFTVLETATLPVSAGSDIEALAVVDFEAGDEVYTLAEDQGRLSRVTLSGGSLTVSAVWNLEVLNNAQALPPETGGAGAEGLEYVPDANLLSAGFRLPNGDLFSGSSKGMGGLIFVGHQSGGRLHVFDVNPGVSEDFVNHGSFATARTEIAGLHFDRNLGWMYIWHNPLLVNSLEVTGLRSNTTVGVVDVLAHYTSGMPAGNLEGLAVVSPEDCGAYGSDATSRSLFLARDGGSPNLEAFRDFPCEEQIDSSINPAVLFLLMIHRAVNSDSEPDQ